LLQAQSNVNYEDIVENIAIDDGRNISKGTVTQIRDKYEETESLIDKPRCGRPKLLRRKFFIRRHKREYPLSYYNMNPRYDKKTVKVWGCISIEGVGLLIRYFYTMDDTKLLKIYDNFLIKRSPNLRGTSTRPGALLFQ